MSRILHVICVASSALVAGSCDLLKQTLPTQPLAGFSRPTITFQGATLVESPSQRQMQAYYCPQVVPDPFGVPGAAATGCRQFFGAPPPIDEMRVSFDLRFQVHNPNDFPVPLAEILAAATVFPEATRQSLGAVCVKLCAEGDAACVGGPDPGGCRAGENDIRSIDDFQRAAENFLVAQGVALMQGRPPSFVAPKIATSGDLVVVVRYSFGPVALLETMKQLARQAVDRLKRGESVTFQIPYRLEGTVWVDAGSFGRVAVGFGPASGTWVIPTERIRI